MSSIQDELVLPELCAWPYTSAVKFHRTETAHAQLSKHEWGIIQFKELQTKSPDMLQLYNAPCSLLPQAGEGLGMRVYALQQIGYCLKPLTLTLSRLRERELFFQSPFSKVDGFAETIFS